jgi:hypothetical protein
LSLTRGRGLLRGQPSWPRGKLTTNREQPVVATMKVANNSNNNNNNNNKQGQERKDNAPLSVVLKKVTDKAHNPSLEKGRSPRTEQKERHPIRPQRPSPDIAAWTNHPVAHSSSKLTKKEEEEEEWGHPLDGVACGVIHNARYWRRLERKVKEDEEKRRKEEERRKMEDQERAKNPPFYSKKVVSVSRNFLEDFSKLNFNDPSLPNSKL